MSATAAGLGLRLADKRRRERRWLLAGAGLLACIVALAGFGIGALPIPPATVLHILAAQLGLADPAGIDPLHQQVFLAIRAPRVLLGFGVGASLALAGAAMQGVFRNPLADPGLIGVSAGAALAAACIIVIGPPAIIGAGSLLRPWMLPLSAFGGGLLATAAVYLLARHEGRVVTSVMLLAGVALNALVGAAIGWLTFIATDEQLRSLTFWTLGSVGGASWASVLPTLTLALLAAIGLLRLAPALNLLALGEAEARYLGSDPARTARLVACFAAVAVAAAVASAGMVGFVGLVAPHLVRLLVGPDHRVVLPGAALAGGTLVVLADIVARTVVVPAELPLGVVTALVGVPFFFWLLLRSKRTGGGE
jgi:iron complex transport system permease protein